MLTRSIDNQVTDKQIILNFDICGNAYLKVNENNIYQINIDNKDEIYLEKGRYDILDTIKLSIEKLNQNVESDDEEFFDGIENISDDEEYNDSYIKAKREEEKEMLIESDDEDEETQTVKLFPEDEKYEKQKSTNKKKFTFASYTSECIDVNVRKYGDIKALYDTIVYDEKCNIIFKTFADDFIMYRLNIYYDGRLVFRPIGGTNLHYAVSFDSNNEIILFRI